MKLFNRSDPERADFYLKSIHGDEIIVEGMSPEQVNADLDRMRAWLAAELDKHLGHLVVEEGTSPEQVDADSDRARAWLAAELDKHPGHLDS